MTAARLVALEVQRLPGIAPGFTLDGLTDQVTLITGPNAVGKSSLIRALRYLLAPLHGDDPPGVVVAACFDIGGRRYRVERVGSRVTWSQDGAGVSPPAQISVSFIDCYWLGVEDLLTAADTDHAIAREILTALSGGFDLQAVRDGSPFRLVRTHGRTEAQALRQAETALREARARQREWVAQEQRLPELESKAARSRRAADRAEALRRALALLDSNRECARAEACLADYPAGMERLQGDEARREAELGAEIESLAAEQAEAREAAARARQQIEAAGPGGLPDADQVEALEASCQDLARDEQALTQAESRLALAEAAIRESVLQTAGEDGELPELTAGVLNDIGTLADRVARQQAEVTGLQARLGEPVEDPGEAAVERLMRAVDALREWLRAPDPDAVRPWRMLAWAALILGVAGTVVTTLSVMDGAATLRWVPLPTALLAAMGAGALYAMRGDHRQPAQARFETCGLAQPAWYVEDVGLCLAELEQRLQAARRARDAAMRRQDITGELERARAELNKSLKMQRRLSERLGLSADTHVLSQAAFAAALKNLVDARVRRAEARAEVERLSAALGRRRALLAKTLQHLGAPADSNDAAAMQRALTGLKRRLGEVQQARGLLETSTAAVARTARDLERRREQRVELYTRAGLDEGQTQTLHERLRRLEAWHADMQALRDARAVAASRRAEVDDPDDLAAVDEGNRAALEQALAAAEQQAAASRAAVEELADLRARLALAGSDTRLARTRAVRDAAQAELESAWWTACRAQAGQLLLDQVEKEFTSRHQPAVLEDGRRLFGEFTHHAFDFEPDAVHGLLARDQASGEVRTLRTLSAGTRMQLLLALRVAWVRHLEHGGAAWPLVLDEALTTSDPARFAAVVGALHTLADEEGRQIIYLTAQPADVLLWERAAGRRPPVIDLGALRFRQPDAAAEDYRLPAEQSLPPPGDATPEDYAARLGVPPLDPGRDAGQVPVFYLLRDRLELLHSLMATAAVHNLGQLEALLRSPGAARLIDDAVIRRELAARIRVTRLWLAAWRRGRGRPVDRAVLEMADGVTDTMLDRVAQAAARAEGDAAALLAALEAGEVKAYRAAAREQLAEWLHAEGYLDPAPVADASQRRRETAMQLDDDVSESVIDSQITWLEAAAGSVAR